MGDDGSMKSNVMVTDPRFTKSYVAKDARKKKRKDQKKARKKNRNR